jgi:hypothetical protein
LFLFPPTVILLGCWLSNPGQCGACGEKHNQQSDAMAKLGCPHCKKTFPFQMALQQHLDAKHPTTVPEVICQYCDREFRSQEALQQHMDAKHSYESEETDDECHNCEYCEREFHSLEEWLKHTQTKHRFEPEVCEMVPFPGAEGEWVYRQQYRGGGKNKGFGIFVCNSCSRFWISAHAYRDKYGQECQGCSIKTFAYIMWQSSEYRVKDRDEGVEASGPPHDASRCDACRDGNYCTKIPTSPLPPFKNTSAASTPTHKPSPSHTPPPSAKTMSTAASSTTVRRDVSFAKIVSTSNHMPPTPTQDPPTRSPQPPNTRTMPTSSTYYSQQSQYSRAPAPTKAPEPSIKLMPTYSNCYSPGTRTVDGAPSSTNAPTTEWPAQVPTTRTTPTYSNYNAQESQYARTVYDAPSSRTKPPASSNSFCTIM